MFKDNPGDVPAPFVEAELGVLTETSGHPQLCFWRLKRRAVLSQNTSTLEKNSTYHGRPAPHWERLNRDRYVRCSLICSGPNHCEAHGGGGHTIFRNLETHCSASFISTSVFIAYYDILSNDVFSLVRLLRGTNLPFFLERGFQTPLSPCDFPPMSRPTLSHKGATETIFSSCLISQLMFSRDFPNWINTTHINTKLPC